MRGRSLSCVLILALLMGPGGSAGAAPAVGGEDPVPFGCERVAGAVRCPDLFVDPMRARDLEIVSEFYSTVRCEVKAGYVEPGMRRLLRFSFASVNLGDGDLVIGPPEAHPDRFEDNPCHGHHHLKAYAHYHVWTPEAYARWSAVRAASPDAPATELLAAHPDLADGLVSGAKVGFCARDTRVYIPGPPRFTTCHDQGITWGWADEYPKNIPLQFVDITGLAPGAYVLDLEVNPERAIMETSWRNNGVALPLRVP